MMTEQSTAVADTRIRRFPRGANITAAQLDEDPYPVLAELREHEVFLRWVMFTLRRDDRPSSVGWHIKFG